MESKKSDQQKIERKKQKKESLREDKKEEKQNKENEQKPRRKSKKGKTEKKKSSEVIKESEKDEIKKGKKQSKRKSSMKENNKKSMDKLEKEMKKLEIKEKKKISKEIEDKYKEIKFYLPNPFKLDSNEIKKLTQLSKENCLICQQKYKINSEVLYMPCLHLYHKECIIRWLINNDKCPTCKLGYKDENAKIQNENQNEINNNLNDYINSIITDEDKEILRSIGIDDLGEYLNNDSDDSDENDFSF